MELTIKAAAKKLGVHYRLVYKWLTESKYKLEFKRFGSAYVIEEKTFAKLKSLATAYKTLHSHISDGRTDKID